MHASSLENMQKCYETYICGNYFSSKQLIKVLDIGGANVNGSYADIFSPDKFQYVAADLEASDGIDMVLDDPYKIPCDDSTIDILISGQAFEHVEFFWLLFEEMTRVTKDDGWIFLIAPSAGPIHRYPVDCYRFYPDAYRALAKYTNVRLINVFHDPRGPWKDLVGVFSKNKTAGKSLDSGIWRPLKQNEINLYIENNLPVTTTFNRASNEVETVSGSMFYLEILEYLHKTIKPSNYFEIGVRKGKSLSLATCPSIAIDPDPAITLEDYHLVNLFISTSDYFFEHNTEAIAKTGIDLAFIDGMHLFEFVLRDFMNIESHSNNSTLVVIDDIFPNNEVQASRERKSQVWMGDVWKIVICLKRFRPDLTIQMLNASPSGLLLISGLQKTNQTLIDNYNPIVKEFKTLSIKNHENLILKRSYALNPSSALEHLNKPNK